MKTGPSTTVRVAASFMIALLWAIVFSTAAAWAQDAAAPPAPKPKKGAPSGPMGEPPKDPFGDLEKLDESGKQGRGIQVPWEQVLPKSYLELLSKAQRPNAKATVHQKKHADVLQAFKPVVRRAALGTVFIISGSKVVALGTIVDRKGEVLTKASVISRQPVIRYNNGAVAAADVVAVHEDYDLALLRPRPGQPKSGMPVRFDKEPPLPGMLAAAPAPNGKVIASGVISVATRRPTEAKGFLGIAPKETEDGVIIERVVSDTAAAACGLKPGDVLVRINDHKIETANDVFLAIGDHAPGEEITIVYRRGDEEHTGKAVLGSRNFGSRRAGRFERMNRMSGPRSSRRTGFPFVLQHDLEIPPQLCGGPLVNIDGQVVGINIARAGRVQTLAIPADRVVELLAEMKSGKHATPEDFGRATVDVDREIKAIRAQIQRLQKRLQQLESQRPH